MLRIYQNSSAMLANSVNEAATCWFVLNRCSTFDVSYKIAVPAKATITNAKTLPSENPKIALETMKQIESQLLMRHYEGFLK